MKSSWRVSLHGLLRSGSKCKYSRVPAGVTVGRLSFIFVAFVLWDGVSLVTGKPDELGFQATPSSMLAVAWT